MCGIVGIYHKKEPACGDVYDALIQVQHRGQDAAGISTWDTEKILTHKYTGLVTEVFKHQKTFDKLVGNIGIGHVRYPTAGGDNVSEAQPFFTANPVNISLAHNGTLTNSEKLKEELIRINFCQFNTNSDSEVLLKQFCYELYKTNFRKLTKTHVYKALNKLANYARQRTKAKIIGITGSSGKTTLKEMISSCLIDYGKVHKSERSFNNHIGVPLSLSRVPDNTNYCILELGMNKVGEIKKRLTG